jgi:hypothetical protein
VLAAASAIAHVEIRSGADGFTVRTGWSASAPAFDQRFRETPSASVSARGDMLLPVGSMSLDAAFVDSIDRRLRALETASRDSGHSRNASASSEADIIRRVREMLAQSETRQQGQLALRIAQVIRDVDAQRVADLSGIQQGLRGIQRTVTAEAEGHRELTNYLLTSSKQK